MDMIITIFLLIVGYGIYKIYEFFTGPQMTHTRNKKEADRTYRKADEEAKTQDMMFKTKLNHIQRNEDKLMSKFFKNSK